MKQYDFQQYNIFPSFRKHQEETIKQIVDFCHSSPKRFLFVQAPTGSGKSIMAYVAARYLTDYAKHVMNCLDEYNHSNIVKDAYLLTSKNLLLDQYFRDFNRYMPICKGRAHYLCNLDHKPCNEASCLKSKKPSLMPCYSTCLYQLAKRRMMSANVSATNFAYLLKIMRTDAFIQKDLCIVDECQAIESVLRDEFVVQMTESTLQVINDLKENMRKEVKSDILSICMQSLKKYKYNFKKIDITKIDYNNINEVNEFVEKVAEDIGSLYLSLSNALDRYTSEFCGGNEVEALQNKEYKEMIKKCDFLKHLLSTIKDYIRLRNSVEWVVQDHKTARGAITGFELKPVTIELLTTDLFNKIAKNKVVMMSATIGDPERFAKSLGIPFDEVEFIDVPATFPVENRPFVKWPICSMSYKNMDENMPKIAEACDAILDMYPDQKGIIHSVSFKNAIYLRDHMQNSKRVLIHDQVSKNYVLEQFIKSKNSVLISPSLIEGFDFKGDLSEFQIFIKVPYMSLADKVVARRLQLDEEWYINNAVLQILQGVGRSVRSETDVAATFCLDNNINFLLSKYKHLFTKDFLSTVVSVSDYA